MAYIALYRKYRPQNFSDMVGQEHITKILKNQIISNKISHAYVFSGTRGTGKTTAAKVFARAINCLNPKDGEPCNECEACKSILENNTTDVVEMDAASNNSVENIRSLRQEVQYSTTGLKYKVYIIDEAHMLSTSAFNALLKTLEEPPENVVFIMATTEEHKIIPTILSRCIRFEFKKISKEDIIKRLHIVLDDLKIEYESDAIKQIAELADGGMRDALSILERCITSADGKVSLDKINEIIGTVPKQDIEEIVKAILEYSVDSVEERIEKFIESGKDLRNIASSITEKFLDILIAVTCEKYDNLSDYLKESAKKTSILRLHEIIKELSKLDDDLRQTSSVALLFRAKLLGLALAELECDEKSLLAKIKELELRIEKLELNGVKIKESSNVETKPKLKEEAKEIKEEKPVITNEKEAKNTLDINRIMKKALDKDDLKLYSALAGTNLYEENGIFVIQTTNSFAYGILNKENTKEEIKSIINEEYNSNLNVKIDYIKEEVNKTPNEFESYIKDSGVPFEIVD